jgi:hypothetical protein
MIRVSRPMSKSLRSLAALSALLGAFSALGCSSLDNCPDAESPKLITTGITDSDRGTYESCPWGGKLDHFPAKSKLWFEHGLGVTPLNVMPYLAFRDVGTGDGDHGSVAPSAGNQSLIDCVDSHYIVLDNDTCEPNFYVRVTADGIGDDRGDSCGPPPAP